jgi:hypothetical protein
VGAHVRLHAFEPNFLASASHRAEIIRQGKLQRVADDLLGKQVDGSFPRAYTSIQLGVVPEMMAIYFALSSNQCGSAFWADALTREAAVDRIDSDHSAIE